MNLFCPPTAPAIIVEELLNWVEVPFVITVETFSTLPIDPSPICPAW